MLEQLPTELFFEILQCAAWMFLANDRGTVVALAQTSKTVHDLIAPTLYHTMIITHENRRNIEQLTTSPELQASAERVCRLVRFLVIVTSPNSVDLKWFTGVHNFSGPSQMITSLPVTALATLKKASLWYKTYVNAVKSLPQKVKETLTHVSGYAWGASDLGHDPDGWCTQIIDTLPALTHIAFEFVDSTDQDVDEFSAENLFMGDLERVLLTALSYPRISCIAIRIAGAFLPRSTDVQQLVLRLKEPRLRVWIDERPFPLWSDADLASVHDAHHGRVVWTEAQPIQVQA
ncbi:hypothetical protein BKA62DRAFT_826408 [Auriculariales sp. MPI-PUGE-AT-0066]|nr:hypothetical protein BKA62DRAFT_826408 [Auriculariales sp. MPI-PUGE-AT-0066]